MTFIYLIVDKYFYFFFIIVDVLHFSSIWNRNNVIKMEIGFNYYLFIIFQIIFWLIHIVYMVIIFIISNDNNS